MRSLRTVELEKEVRARACLVEEIDLSAKGGGVAGGNGDASRITFPTLPFTTFCVCNVSPGAPAVRDSLVVGVCCSTGASVSALADIGSGSRGRHYIFAF